MMNKILNVLPKNLKLFMFFSLGFSLLIFLLVFLFTFSPGTSLLILLISLLTASLFYILELLRQKSAKKIIRILITFISISIIFFSTVAFTKKYDSEFGFSAIYSKQISVKASDDLLKSKGNYKNIVLKVDPDSFSKTNYRIEKIVSNLNDDQNNVSSFWDGDEWINDVIIDRNVLYEYYVFPFDGKHFIAKLSPEISTKLKEAEDEIKFECLISSPSKKEKTTCEAICSDLRNIIYSVDSFEGEDVDNFYSDLELFGGESSVIITATERNLFYERVCITSILSVVVLGCISLLLSILFSPNQSDKKLKM